MTNHEAIQFLKNMQGEENGRAIGAEGFYAELCGYHVQALGMAINALEQTRWIPVSERMPKDGQDVLFCDIDNDIMVGYHVKGRPDTHFTQDGTWEDIKNVRSWMPLPEPYKAESEELAESEGIKCK